MEKERRAKIDTEKEELKELIFTDSDFKASSNLPRKKSYTPHFFQSHSSKTPTKPQKSNAGKTLKKHQDNKH